jgi:Icc-related predicted phosphoesterase
VKALFFTDVHASEGALKWVQTRGRDFDAIMIGGDLASGGSQGFVGRFLTAALSSNGRVLFVQGNADSPDTPLPDEVVSLHGKSTRLGKYTVGGLGGSTPTPFNTPFELKDEVAERILADLGRVDVLLSHCPPHGTKCDKASSGHVGSLPVRRYVERERPLLVLSGHAHEARSMDNLGGTTIVNAGPLMEGKFAEVSLDGVVSVELKAERLGG